jgi:hypothetical protein
VYLRENTQQKCVAEKRGKRACLQTTIVSLRKVLGNIDIADINK